MGIGNGVIWNYGGNEFDQLNEARKFRGENFDDLDFGQWAIVASKPKLTIPG